MSDEERVKLIIQIASNFGISYDEASYIIKSFENFGKEYLMNESEKMFEKLGYEQEEKYREIEYKNNDDKIIIFDLEKKNVTCNNFYSGYESINMQELQAINQKCKELRWIE